MIAKTQSHGGDSILTLVAGTSFVPFSDHDCNEVTILNETGVSIDLLPYCADPVTGFVTLSSPSGITLPTCSNSMEFSVRRNDQTGLETRVRFLFRKWAH